MNQQNPDKLLAKPAIKDRLIVALDVSSCDEALALAKKLLKKTSTFKVGMELFNSEGPAVIERINALGGRVFTDLKFHDIPNTVAAAARVISEKKAFMFTLHASGGLKMMREAVLSAVKQEEISCRAKPLIVGVTVLTSIDPQTFTNELGMNGSIDDHALKLALLCREAGLDGVVCSPWEASAIRQSCGEDFIIVTPGIRPSWAASGDQKRIMTPAEAIKRGATYLVIGRPIIAAANPAAAAEKIIAEMESAAHLL